MSMIYIVVAYLIPILIGLLVYSLIAFLIKRDLKKAIKSYRENETVISVGLLNFLCDKEDQLIKIGAIVWPFTLFFFLGCNLGNEIYKVKTNNNYETRIGAWFVKTNSIKD